MNNTPWMRQNIQGVISLIRKTEYVCVFLTGGIVYSMLEMLWRGYTHWSMTVAGGLCFLMIHLLNQRMHDRDILLRCLIGCLIITGVEFFAGVIVNLWLGLDVWNYSGMAYNLLGQICPAFSLMWFLISFPACALSGLFRRFFTALERRERIPA